MDTLTERHEQTFDTVDSLVNGIAAAAHLGFTTFTVATIVEDNPFVDGVKSYRLRWGGQREPVPSYPNAVDVIEDADWPSDSSPWNMPDECPAGGPHNFREHDESPRGPRRVVHCTECPATPPTDDVMQP